jgi:hypothetical protein
VFWRGKRVKRTYWTVISACFLLISLSGHASGQATGASGTACIRGTVSFKHPVEAKEVPYAGATVSAWVHGEKKGLSETKTDRAGNFCIEVPVGEYRVDLKVWGMERFDQKDYICEGLAEGISPGADPGKCGSGDCIRADIRAGCRERVEGGRR